MTILITGATGAVGRRLTDNLVAEGEPVRAVSRKPAEADLPDGVDVVKADLADPGTLTPTLFDGVDRAFVFPAPGGVDDFVAAAVKNGVHRLVLLSSLAASEEYPRNVRSVSYRHHRAAEEALRSRTDEWTVLRPGTFANNLLAWAWPIRSGAPIRAPYIHSAQDPIHEADIADVAAAVLTQDGHAGKTYPLTGPQSLTKIEQVAAIGAGIGRELRLVEISPDEFRSDVADFITEDIVTMLLDYWSETVAEPDPVLPGVSRLTGRPGRTLEQWAREHRGDFGA